MLNLSHQRQEYRPPIPQVLCDLQKVAFSMGEPTTAIHDVKEIQHYFPKTFGRPLVTASSDGHRFSKPLRVGVIFSGGQAAGGHNVIAGLFDALKTLHLKSRLFGFLGGPSGIIQNKYKELTEDLIAPYRNQGGFDLIGSGRTKIETDEQLKAALDACQALDLQGLVIIGGDDSNTNAAILAEYFLKNGCATTVVGVPKTIDGDLKNAYLNISFGFDTATKTYSELIGNIARDALSAKKYYHFIKVMGRSASHIALECALRTHPNYTFIGEEVAAKKWTLKDLTDQLCHLIKKRAEKGKKYGVIVVPEGLIEFIPEMSQLIKEINSQKSQFDPSKLSEHARSCFEALPEKIRDQFLLERDPHGNVQVSLIETELLLMDAVKKEISKDFNALNHFFGYEGRAGLPTNFDANYCYSLGLTTALLLDEGLTGYMACVGNLHAPVSEWEVKGLPITLMMNMEMRKGEKKPVIQKALVDLHSKAFLHFKKERDHWALDDDYQYPGPIQFFGDSRITDRAPLTVTLDSNSS